MLQQKFVVEIRYLPNPKIIDLRGHIASILTSEKFPEWRVSKDRVDVTGSEGLVFVSFSNLGFVTLKKENIKLCIDRIEEAISLIGDLPPIRWGVRIYTIAPSKKDFKKLLEEYKEKLLKFTPTNFSKIKGNLVDIGISYIFKSEKDRFHLTTGPMEREQASEIFPLESLPDTGIFIDLDIFRDKTNFYKDDFRKSRIIDFINTSFSKGELVIAQFVESLKK